MNPFIPHPDPMPLREVLRGLRHGMRRSRQVLRETVSVEALPGPAALIARPVLDGLDAIAQGVDVAGSDLAKRLLGGEAHRVPRFDVLLAGPDGEEAFAEAAYAALRGALRRMGDGDAFVSESAARRAFAAAVREGPDGRDASRTAASLLLLLLEMGAVRDVVTAPGLRVHADQVAPLAAAATLLWLLADREGVDPDGALDAATDIAVALAGEIGPPVRARDRDRLAGLLGEFAGHV